MFVDRQTHKQTQRQRHNILLPPTLEVELLFAAVARPALDIDCCMAHSRVLAAGDSELCHVVSVCWRLDKHL